MRFHDFHGFQETKVKNPVGPFADEMLPLKKPWLDFSWLLFHRFIESSVHRTISIHRFIESSMLAAGLAFHRCHGLAGWLVGWLVGRQASKRLPLVPFE